MKVFWKELLYSPKAPSKQTPIYIHFWARRLGIQLNLAYRIIAYHQISTLPIISLLKSKIKLYIIDIDKSLLIRLSQ